MKSLYSFIIEKELDKLTINEYLNDLSQDMINESFKADILTKLAEKIKQAEKEGNERKAQSGNKKYMVSFASIFGPKVEKKFGSKTTYQAIKWADLTDSDFTKHTSMDPELKKLLKASYKKSSANAIFIVTKNDEVISFVKCFNKDSKDDAMFIFKSGAKWPGDNGVKELQKEYADYRYKPYNQGDLIAALGLLLQSGSTIWALEITDKLTTEYETFAAARKEEKSGMINYDAKSLAELLRTQKARYKALVNEMKSKKLMDDKSGLFEEIKKANEKVIATYEKVMSKPEYMIEYHSIGDLMSYLSHAYNKYYESMRSTAKYNDDKEKYHKIAAEKGEKADDEMFDKWNFDKRNSESSIRSAKEYLDDVIKKCEEIEKRLPA